MGVYKAWPEMIATPHLPGFFVGENAFHVLAVNSQEATLCELIQMAYDHLERDQVKDCFTSQVRPHARSVPTALASSHD